MAVFGGLSGKVVLVIFLAIPEVIIIRYAYRVWFRPKEHLDMVHGARRRGAEAVPFRPAVWMANVFTQHPRLDLWWARIASLLMVVIGTLVFAVALRSALLEVIK